MNEEFLTVQHTKAELEAGLAELQQKRAVAQLPSVGRIVHFVLANGRYPGEHRPAIIVKLWGTPTPSHTPTVQLQVFTDSSNDFDSAQAGANGLLWATSVPYSEEPKPYTWHWPEKV